MSVLVAIDPQDKTDETIRLWREEEISSRNCELFTRWAQEELEDNRSALVIDLRLVTYVNAAGLASIVKANRLAILRGRRIFWINLDKNVANIFKLAGLHKILEIL